MAVAAVGPRLRRRQRHRLARWRWSLLLAGLSETSAQVIADSQTREHLSHSPDWRGATPAPGPVMS